MKRLATRIYTFNELMNRIDMEYWLVHPTDRSSTPSCRSSTRGNEHERMDQCQRRPQT
jgi:hypothetical protein